MLPVFKIGLIRMSYQIPVMRPSLPKYADVEPLLRSIDMTRIYSNRGPLIRALESEYAEYLGTKPELVVAVANATLGLQGLLEISRTFDWYVPDYTFAATGLAVIKSNKVLHLCDVGAENWKLQISELQNNSNDIGVLPVIPFGASVDFLEYLTFKNVIIDAAASLGRTPPDFSKMHPEWSVVYSLHATKVLGAGEGAIVVCGKEETAEELRSWINFGFNSERTAEICGTNAKMSEFNAAYGLTSLRTFYMSQKDWIDSQTLVAEYGKERPWMTWVNSSPAFQPYWIIDLEDSFRKIHIEKTLNAFGIQSRSWWAKPLSKQNAFKSCNRFGNLNISNDLALRHLGLPMFPGLSENEVRYIVSAIDQGLLAYKEKI